MRNFLDNTELLEAADCLESYAQALEDEGDIEGAEAQRDTVRAFRHISDLSLESKETTETRPGVIFSSVTVVVRGTSEGTITQRRKSCQPK